MKGATRSLFICIVVLATLAICPVRGVSGPTVQSETPLAGMGQSQEYEYKVLATNRTSTMEKELNQAADAGFRFEACMGGETAFGGSETVAVMSKPVGNEVKPHYEYKLVATTRTSTMQKELQEAGDAGFLYRDQTVFKSTFGGKEVAVILERDRDVPIQHYEYKLLATSRTSTMEKELKDAGSAGFEFVGMSVGQTSIGGQEVVCILRRLEKK
jgi:hypothetical protein